MPAPESAGGSLDCMELGSDAERMKIQRKSASEHVKPSPSKTVGKERRRETNGTMTTTGKTKVSSGAAAAGPCKLGVIAGKRLSARPVGK